jgi:hypothetical protein
MMEYIFEITFDLYCDAHETPLCSKCISGHKRCVRILPISYVSRNSKFSTKLWDVEHGIAHILGNIEEIIKKKKENIQTVKDEKLNIENELKRIRTHLLCPEIHLLQSGVSWASQ